MTSDDHTKKLQSYLLSSFAESPRQIQEANSLRDLLSAHENKLAVKNSLIKSLQDRMDLCARTAERTQIELDSHRLTSSTNNANLQAQIRSLQTDATQKTN